MRFREATRSQCGGLRAAGFIYNKPLANYIQGRMLDDYALVYVVDGEGDYADRANGRRSVRRGDALLLFPGLKHFYGPKSNGNWSEYFLIFQGAVFEQLEKEGLLDRRRPVLSPGLVPAFAASFSRLVEDFLADPLPAEAILTARTFLLVSELAELHARAQHGPAGGDFARRATALLEENLAAEADLAAVARTFHLSYERFRKRFAEEVGVPPARYRTLRRIDLAKALLTEGRLPLKTVAERLGYCDLYFFCRQFKQVTGVPPGAFRKSV